MSLSVKNLFKRYGDNWIFKDVSFNVNQGEIFGIFGLTEAGKTTLLKALAGSEPPNGGVIAWQDSDIGNLSENELVFLPRSPENNSSWRSFFSGNNKTYKSGSQRLDEIAARALAVVILDDPFCGMDSALRQRSVRKLRKTTRDKGLAVVLATSNYDEIFDACDRVGVLVDRDIKQVGTPQEVYDHPNCSAVATAVGRNNIFSTRRLTSSKSDHPEFITLVGEHRLFAQKTGIKTLGSINKNVLLAIRPENVSISFGASFPEDNLLKAIVTGVKPRGASTLVELDSNGLKLEAMVLRLVGLNVGDECMLGLPPDRIQVLAD